MRIEAVICDLDGTVVDSEPVHMEAWNDLIRHYGHTPPGTHWHDDCIGLPDSAARDKTIKMFPGLAVHRDEIVPQKERIFRDLVRKMGRAIAYPGVHDRLAKLRDQGVRLAIGTNCVMANCETSLRASELAEFFPVVVTMDQVPRGKPHPDIYLTAAERLSVPPENCLVLEDSTAGVQAGKAAGCQVAGIENTWTAEKLQPADRFFPDTVAALDWALENAEKNT